MKNFKLWVHNSSFSEDDLVIDPKEFPDIGIGDVLEIYHPDEQDSHLLLQVRSFTTTLQQKDIISVEHGIANLFKLRAYNPVCVEKVVPNSVAIDLVEFLFKEQYISRSDMWRLKQSLLDTCIHFHQKVEYLGIRAQVQELWANGQRVTCGFINGDTRVTFRSSTAIVSMFIQMSSEMWEFDTCGDLYMEKAVNGFLTELFHKWKDRNICHEVSIVLFSRTFYEAHELEDIPEAARCRVHMDSKGRIYEDFYRVLVQNMRQDDWMPFLVTLKRIMQKYEKDIEDAINKVPGMPKGTTSKSSQGNIIEAINMALNVFDNHYINRNFDRTGQLVNIITPGAGVIEVDRNLCEITKQRMIDYGIGSDLVCLAEQPPHPVPLVIYHESSEKEEPNFDKYNILHWLNHSFYMSQSQRRILASSNFTFMPRMRIPERKINLGEEDVPMLPKLKTPHPLTKYYENGESEAIDEDEIYRQHDRKIFQTPETSNKCSGNNPFFPSNLKVKLTADRRRWTHTFPHGPTGEVVQMHHQTSLKLCRTCSGDSLSSEDRMSTSTSGSSLQGLAQDSFTDLDVSGIPPPAYGIKKRVGSTWGVTGEQRWCPCIVSDVDWKSLTTTACFPLTTDFYPDKSTLERDYGEAPYTMDIQDESQTGERTPAQEIFEELIAQRLIQDFQLVIIRDSELQLLQQKGSSHVPLVSNPPKNEYVLSYGTTFHHISLNAEKTTIKVVKYSKTGKKHVPRMSYTFSLWPVGKSAYELSKTRVYHEPLDFNDWNYRDNYIRCGGALGDESEESFQLNERLKFWRSRFLLLPAFTPVVKKINDSGYTGPYDVFELPSKSQKQQLLEGFLRFAESLNKRRRPMKSNKLSADNTHSPNLLPARKSSRSSGTATPTATSSNTPSASTISQVLSNLTSNVRDDLPPSSPSLSAPISLNLTTPLPYIMAAMKEQSSGITFVAGEQRGLPPFTFTSSEAVNWVLKHFEDDVQFDDAVDLMQVLLKNVHIQEVFASDAKVSSTGETKAPSFTFGYKLYFITPESDLVDSSKTKNRSSVHYDNPVESPVWFEVACVSPESKKVKDPPPCYKSMEFELDCTKNQCASEQFQRCQLGFHERYIPDRAFEMELQWLTSSPNSLLEVLTTWSRRAFPLGLHFVPSIVDPFASLEDISDPMSRPVFIPLKLPFKVESESVEKIQKTILQRFGFILDHTSKYSPVKLAMSSDQNVEEYFHQQYVHATGHVFVLPKSEPFKELLQESAALLNKESAKCICHKDAHKICILSSMEAVCSTSQKRQVDNTPGFLWVRNHLMSKRWKTQATGDEKLHDQLIADFKRFCNNDEGRLEELIHMEETEIVTGEIEADKVT